MFLLISFIFVNLSVEEASFTEDNILFPGGRPKEYRRAEAGSEE